MKLPNGLDIRATDYEKLPGSILPILADVIFHLRPDLLEHFPGMVNFFAFIQNPSQARERFELEYLSRQQIEEEKLGSKTLTSLFIKIRMSEPADQALRQESCG